MPDPVTAITVGGAAVGTAAGLVNVAGKQFQDFIAAVSGRPGESIGTMLGNLLHRRQVNAEAVGNKANLILLNIGVQAQQVPLPVLMPLLEGASLQEEPSMQEMWANLLANAAHPSQNEKVLPVFVSMLKELTSSDAILLTALHDRLSEEAAKHHKMFFEIGFDIFRLRMIYTNSVLQIPTPPEGQHYGIAVDNWFRARIETFERQGVLKAGMGRPFANTVGTFQVADGITEIWSMSNLGWAFMAACRTPQPETASSQSQT